MPHPRAARGSRMRHGERIAMATVSTPQATLLQAIRDGFGRMPWVEAVLVALDPSALQVWTVPPPPDSGSEDTIYDGEAEIIRAFPEVYFDFHFAGRGEVEDLGRAGAVVAFSRPSAL